MFVVKNFDVLEFNNCVCKFDKNKNKNLNIKKNCLVEQRLNITLLITDERSVLI